MRAILIDPVDQSVEYIDVGTSVADVKEVLDCEIFVEIGQPAEGHVAFADDEGIERVQDMDTAMMTAWHPAPVFGRVLIVGVDEDTGEEGPVALSLASIEDKVMFAPVVFSDPDATRH